MPRLPGESEAQCIARLDADIVRLENRLSTLERQYEKMEEQYEKMEKQYEKMKTLLELKVTTKYTHFGLHSCGMETHQHLPRLGM